MVSKKNLEKAVENASKAFWGTVQAEFPELDPDKLDIGVIIVLQWQMKDAIERYLATGEE
jgi:hypothetical protein